LNECTKAITTKQFFPNVQHRLKMNINVTLNFATMVTRHGKTRAYFHHFKIMEQATSPCNNGDQIIDHFFYQCTLFHSPKDLLRNKFLKISIWPAKKRVNNKTFESRAHITNSRDFAQL
jgi:hypothetical protein